jgi:hypothetical protein
MTGTAAAARYCWMRARFADFTHLARDFASQTLCGLAITGSPMREAGDAPRLCPACLAAASG